MVILYKSVLFDFWLAFNMFLSLSVCIINISIVPWTIDYTSTTFAVSEKVERS